MFTNPGDAAHETGARFRYFDGNRVECVPVSVKALGVFHTRRVFVVTTFGAQTSYLRALKRRGVTDSPIDPKPSRTRVCWSRITVNCSSPSQALNNLTANANATFDFENDGNDELLSEMGNEMFSAGRSSDLAADENGDYSDGTAPLADEQPAPDTDGQSTGSVDNSAACFPSAAEPPAADNQFSYETIGFGANKKVRVGYL